MNRLFGPGCRSPYLAERRSDLVQQLPRHTKGFSISGMQPKAQLAVRDGRLTLVDHDGTHILKPSPDTYPGVAENEHVTLKLMEAIGMDVPPCGLIALEDGELVFVIRRYDRTPDGPPIHQEDAMQALGLSNDTGASKYDSASYLDALLLAGRLGGRVLIRDLLDRLVFSYLVGNDDHHLKNISFVYDQRGVRLAPAYDVLASALHTGSNDAMALRFFPSDHEPHNEPGYFREMANGFYSGGDFVELAQEAGLPGRLARKRVEVITEKVNQKASGLIERSFLSDKLKKAYQAMIDQRTHFLEVLD